METTILYWRQGTRELLDMQEEDLNKLPVLPTGDNNAPLTSPCFDGFPRSSPANWEINLHLEGLTDWKGIKCSNLIDGLYIFYFHFGPLTPSIFMLFFIGGSFIAETFSLIGFVLLPPVFL